MKNKPIFLNIALTCMEVICLLCACGDKPPEPPADYALAGEKVESLNTVVGEEKSGEMTKMDTPETKTDGSSSDASNSTGQETCLYTYEKLPTGGETVRLYVEKLTGEEKGFQVVDETETVTDLPDFTQENGSVSLAKTAAETGKILRMDISWTATDCSITLSNPNGEVNQPPVEPVTYSEAVEFMKSLDPTALELEGDRMDAYSIYPMDGAVMVDGTLCLKLQIYPPHEPERANAIAGTYLLTGDKAHVYLLKEGRVRELDV